jgi:hypothetical protein
VAHAEQLGYPPLISRALAMLVNTAFLYGHGVDEANLQRALELEDITADIPLPFCASAVNALIYAWTGQLNTAARQMAAVRDRCVERGAENDMMAVTGYCTLIEMWRGNFAEAAVLADDTMERAEQVGGSRTIALTVRARWPPTPAVNSRHAPMPPLLWRSPVNAAHRAWRSGGGVPGAV